MGEKKDGKGSKKGCLKYEKESRILLKIENTRTQQTTAVISAGEGSKEKKKKNMLP